MQTVCRKNTAVMEPQPVISQPRWETGEDTRMAGCVFIFMIHRYFPRGRDKDRSFQGGKRLI